MAVDEGALSGDLGPGAQGTSGSIAGASASAPSTSEFGTEGEKSLEKVRAELVPDAGGVTAKLHKVNIYEKGGHFADHRDTPRSDTHFGSLVVLLPAFHSGGALSVDHAGERKVVDWGRTGDWEPRYSTTMVRTLRRSGRRTSQPTCCAGQPSSATRSTASALVAPANRTTHPTGHACSTQ